MASKCRTLCQFAGPVSIFIFVLVVGCTTNRDCPTKQACSDRECVNPCEKSNPCKRDEKCDVLDHKPGCLPSEFFVLFVSFLKWLPFSFFLKVAFPIFLSLGV
jgi:hypothetical protein